MTAQQPEPQAPASLAWGQPSELCDPARPPTCEFVDELKQLADIYRHDRSDETWMTKQWFGAHYSYFGGKGHELLRKYLSFVAIACSCSRVVIRHSFPVSERMTGRARVDTLFSFGCRPL